MVRPSPCSIPTSPGFFAVVAHAAQPRGTVAPPTIQPDTTRRRTIATNERGPKKEIKKPATILRKKLQASDENPRRLLYLWKNDEPESSTSSTLKSLPLNT
ncbi:hypothetical protein PENSPDRAFT_686923 [Peniophora sp. CONT]|nr:hypothetical protein PENSPDRAFT_686923 [Peniophora sp. CONT]